jgi:imidazoleglycerol-phosphate dehydratase
MRKAVVERKTREVDIRLELNLDGKGYEIKTPIPFFTHMLETFARHSGIGLKLKASGDIEVDEHHTIEDVAISLGKAIKDALGDKAGIARFGDAVVPMDESVAICGVDISGRGYLNFDSVLDGDVGGISAENFIHFFDTLCRNAGINAYILVKGSNLHHMVEVCFKAFAIALRKAIAVESEGVKSTKGVLD